MLSLMSSDLALQKTGSIFLFLEFTLMLIMLLEFGCDTVPYWCNVFLHDVVLYTFLIVLT